MIKKLITLGITIFFLTSFLSGCIENDKISSVHKPSKNENITNISTIGYLVNYSNEFINKTICITGTTDHEPGIFLAYMCPPDDPCCLSGIAALLLYDGTGEIRVSNIVCIGDNCNNWNCSLLELNRTYKVTGNWTGDGLELISFELIA